MKKIISILVLGAAPAFAMAGGEHGGGHDMKAAHVMEQQQHTDHDMSGMSGMSHDEHEADAGRPGDPDKVTRTVEVTMDDNMRFSPGQLDFRAGETVRFVVRNNGRIRHEMVIGSVSELKEHAGMMRADPAMQHADSNMISLAPGQSGDLVWQFDKSGSFDFACLVPGHLEAGMTGKVVVE